MKFFPFIFIFLLLSCSSTKKNSAAILKVNIKNDPQTLDPRKVRDLNDICLCKHLYEGLVREIDGKLVNALAEKVEISEDKKVYKFHLKKTFWSNGKPLRAEDFLSTFKNSLDPTFISPLAHQLFVIKNAKAYKEGKTDRLGVYVLKDDLLVIELEKPVPYFLKLLSLPIFFPYKEKVYSGPYSLKAWKKNSEIRIEKNPFYWDNEAVRIEKIDFYMVSENTELILFNSHELHWAGSPLSILPQDLSDRKDVRKKAFYGTAFFRINQDFFKHLIPDKEKRIESLRSLSSSINRDEISSCLLKKEMPACRLVPSLEKGSFSSSFCHFKKVKISYPNQEKAHQVVQVIQQYWEKKLGIRVFLEPLEKKLFYEKIQRQDYQIAFSNWIADLEDPINFLELFYSKEKALNKTGWEDKEFQVLLDQSFSFEENDRKRVLKKAEDILLENCVVIPLYHLSLSYLCSSNLKNVDLSSLGTIDFSRAELIIFKKAKAAGAE